MEKEKRKGWFYSYNMIFEMQLTEHAKLIYVYLCRLADSKGSCYPSIEHIGEACGIKSRTTIHRAVHDLENLGLIKIRNRKRIVGGNTSNEYTVFDSPKK